MRKSSLALSLVLPFASLAAPERVFSRDVAGICWQDGVFLGNGSLGLVAYAPMGLEWTVNRNTVFHSLTNEIGFWTHAKVKAEIARTGAKDAYVIKEGWDDPRLLKTLSAATLRLRFWGEMGWGSPSAPKVSERLDLFRGELTQCLRAGLMDIGVTSLAERGRDVAVFRISARDLGRKWKPVFELSEPPNEMLEPKRRFAADGVEGFTQALPGGTHFAVAFARSADGHDAFLAVRSSRECADPRGAAVAAVTQARTDGFDAVRDEHRAWWKDFWENGGDASFESEPEVDLKWHLALYTLASNYGRPPMPGLNGLFYGPYDERCPGLGAAFYTHDQNVQIPMFAFNPVNRVGFLKSFSGTYLSLADRLRAWTHRRFDSPGIYLPLCLNPDGRERACQEYSYTLDGAAYSGLVLATAWKYSRDRELLRTDVYPLLKEFVTFYLSLMRRGNDGLYHLEKTVPPEIFLFTEDSTSVLAMLKACLETAVEGSEVLNVDEDLRMKWKDVLAHYPPYARQSEGGWWCGKDVPDDYWMFGGHLFYPFYPSETALTAADRATALKTLDYLYRHGCDVSWLSERPHHVSEWTAYYAGVTRMRLVGGAAAWAGLKDFLADFGKPNGLFSHNTVLIADPSACEVAWERNCAQLPRKVWDRASADVTANPRAKEVAPAVIEGSGAFVFMGAEALLQSWGGEIRLFPGVPKDFTGSFTNFLAQGGKRVSAKMVKGEVVWKEIK